MTSTMALTQHAEIEFLMLPVRVSSYLHSELNQLHCWERDVTKPGGREVGNKAEPKPICHSATGVLTIIGCHHFLIRPVSKKCGNTTALQKEHPHTHPSPPIPNPPHCTQIFRVVLFMYTHITKRHANTSNVSESAPYPL